MERAVDAMGRGGSENGYIGNRVSNFLAQISAQDAHGVVYDPACGIGDVLTQLSDLGQTAGGPITWMVGHDIDPSAIVLADQRGLLHNAPLELDNVDVLAKDPSPDLRADLIVADPPYGMHYDKYDLLDRRWAHGTPSQSSSELAWIQHAIWHLADDGVAYVVTSAGPLFRSGRDAQIRRALIQGGCIEAVYALPPKLLQHTSMPVAVWVLRKPGGSRSIRFVDAKSADASGGRKAFEQSNPSADVSIADVLAGDANLVPERWIGLDTPDPATVLTDYRGSVADIEEVGRATKALNLTEFSATGPARVATIGELEGQGTLSIHTGRLRKGDQDDPRRVTAMQIAHRDLPPSPGSGLEPEGDGFTAPGDVLVSTVGHLAVALDTFGGHILGTGIVGLRVQGSQLRPDYLAAVVDGRWNKRFLTGRTIQRVAVRDLEVPVLTLEDQEAFARAAADLRNVRHLAEQLQSAAAEALESLSEVARYGTETDPNGA